ncbi:MAG: [Fe-Fe] hydrogenase large subunit C-terminal domain-containing protein [Halanaerobiaceae bacterium]
MKKHSVLLRDDKCEGCTNCVKNCPTKAIRVHQGKASIREEFCIDCAECIRTCEYHAKYTETDELEVLENYSRPVALVPPSFYGQFGSKADPVEINLALQDLGFANVYDAALAAEAISWKTASFLQENTGPFISSSCPVVVRLIKLLYPELINYLMPFKSPVELMAQHIIDEDPEADVIFITPCPAKLTAVENPPGQDRSYITTAVAVDKVYPRVLDMVKTGDYSGQEKDNLPFLGIGWGRRGGEEKILYRKQQDKVVSVAGIHNVKKLLEELSRENISGVKYFELVSCPQGCVGGVLNVRNPYQARFDIKRMAEGQEELQVDYDNNFDFSLDRKFTATEAGKLDDDIGRAMEKLTRLEEVKSALPGLDCAACGAPDCETLAEDIVNGLADRTDCIFMLRKEVSDLADRISSLTHVLPPVMSEKEEENETEADN